jgi:hypothetical protein
LGSGQIKGFALVLKELVFGKSNSFTRTNLVVQTLSDLPVVSQIEDLLQSLYAYFNKSPKQHLQFVKLTEVLQSKGLKILKNVKTRWISILSPAVRVMNEYKVLLVIMKEMSSSLDVAQKNLNLLCDVQVLLGLSRLLPMLRCAHLLMQFAQSRDVFVCDYIAAIQVCQAEITSFYIDDATTFSHDLFWDFKALCQTRHDAIPLA